VDSAALVRLAAIGEKLRTECDPTSYERVRTLEVTEIKRATPPSLSELTERLRAARTIQIWTTELLYGSEAAEEILSEEEWIERLNASLRPESLVKHQEAKAERAKEEVRAMAKRGEIKY
jgi:hypothetical protein